MTPRVALDASACAGPPGGMRRYVEQLVGAMPPEAVRWSILAPWDVDVLGVGSPGASSATFARRRAGPPRPSVLWQLRLAPRLAKAARADVVHWPTGRGGATAGIPSVVTVHDLSPLEHPEWYPWRDRVLVAPWLRSAIRGAAAVVAVSAFTAQRVRVRFPAVAERVGVIPEAAAPLFGQPVPAERIASVRAAFGLGPRVWLHVGAGRPRKNTDRLLEAFARVLANPSGAPGTAGDRLQPAPQLVLVGGPRGARDRLRSLARRLGIHPDVRWLARVGDGDLAALYALAEIVAQPSREEGFGLVVVEAMAGGAAVLAGDAGAAPEVAGDAALLVDAASADAIAAGLARLAGDGTLRAALGAKGRKRAERFNWSAAADATAAVYRQVAGLPMVHL